MKIVSLALLVALAPVAALSAAAQAPIVQNNRVTVWDVAPGAPAPAASPSRDVVMFIIRGDVSNAQGTLANNSGHPPAFPRAGIQKLPDGTLSGTDEKGETGSSEHRFGLIRANARGRLHTQMLASGKASATQGREAASSSVAGLGSDTAELPPEPERA